MVVIWTSGGRSELFGGRQIALETRVSILGCVHASRIKTYVSEYAFAVSLTLENLSWEVRPKLLLFTTEVLPTYVAALMLV